MAIVLNGTTGITTPDIDSTAGLDAADGYKSDRAAAYPSIEDQLDDIFHNGIDSWKAKILAIKQAYPKPEGN